MSDALGGMGCGRQQSREARPRGTQTWPESPPLSYQRLSPLLQCCSFMPYVPRSWRVTPGQPLHGVPRAPFCQLTERRNCSALAWGFALET